MPMHFVHLCWCSVNFAHSKHKLCDVLKAQLSVHASLNPFAWCSHYWIISVPKNIDRQTPVYTVCIPCAYLPYVYRVYIIRIPCVYRMYTVCISYVYHVYTMCINHLYTMCVYHVYTICMPCVYVLPLCISCVYRVYTLYTLCIPCVYPVYTVCILWVHCKVHNFLRMFTTRTNDSEFYSQVTYT